jgi:hypothetical protein
MYLFNTHREIYIAYTLSLFVCVCHVGTCVLYMTHTDTQREIAYTLDIGSK